MKTRSQRTAQIVYEQVKQVQQDTHWKAEARKKYGVWCHRLGLMVRRHGLAQTLGVLRAKAETHAGEDQAVATLLAHLAHLLKVPNTSDAILQEQVRETGHREYQHLTRLTLEAAPFYKRYAQILLNVDTTSGREA